MNHKRSRCPSANGLMLAIASFSAPPADAFQSSPANRYRAEMAKLITDEYLQRSLGIFDPNDNLSPQMEDDYYGDDESNEYDDSWASIEDLDVPYSPYQSEYETLHSTDPYLETPQSFDDTDSPSFYYESEFFQNGEFKSISTPSSSIIVHESPVVAPPPLPDTNDPYELLGLDPQTPPLNGEVLRRAFIQRAKQYHPDTMSGPNSTAKERQQASTNFAKINNAYRFLRKKQKEMETQYEFMAQTTGGSAYHGSRDHVRRSYMEGYGFDGFSGSVYSGSRDSNGFRDGRRAKRPSANGNWANNGYGESRFFGRGQEARDNCHASGKVYPPFFSH